MKDVIYEFLDYITFEKKYSEYTEKNYELDLDKFTDYLKKCNKKYNNLKYNDIGNYLIYLKECGYKSSSINRNLSALKSFYNFLHSNKKISANPFDLIKSLKTEKKLPNYFKYSEFETMLKVLDENTPLNIRNRLILEFLLATGVRVSELANMKLTDIYFNERKIKIKGKGNKERMVYFGSYAADALKDYIENSRNILLRGKVFDYLFINNNGTKLTDRGIRLIIEQIIKKSSLTTKVSPHTFRHSFATILLNEGCSIKSVGELLGHSSLNTTSIYTHLTNEEIRNVYLKTHPRAREDVKK